MADTSQYSCPELSHTTQHYYISSISSEFPNVQTLHYDLITLTVQEPLTLKEMGLYKDPTRESKEKESLLPRSPECLQLLSPSPTHTTKKLSQFPHLKKAKSQHWPL